MEIGNLPKKEFRKRIQIVKMIHDLRKRRGRPRRNKEQTEINNTLEGSNSRITETEEWIK